MSAITDEIADLDRQIAVLQRRKREIEERKEQADSKAYIALTGMSLKDVQLSSGPGVPWFGHVDQFIAWLAQQSPRKRWAEWNTSIHNTTELLTGRWGTTPVRMEDLK